jgi:uncharacterized protein YqeY
MSEESLKSRIQEDMKTAMKAKETLRLGAIRMLLAAVKQKEIDERVTLGDADILSVVNKMIKQRKDSAEQFSAANRPELAEKEQQEIGVLQVYLPAQLSEAEIETAVRSVITEVGAKNVQDMGKVMAALKAKLAGKADFAVVNNKVKEQLSSL